MNNTLTQLAQFLEKQNFKCNSAEDNENVLWVQIGLPHHDLAPLFFVDFNEAKRLPGYNGQPAYQVQTAGGEIMTAINFFNTDPEVFNCKMFIDRTGELVVNNSSIISGDYLVPKIVDRIDLTVRSIDRHFGNFTKILEGSEEKAKNNPLFRIKHVLNIHNSLFLFVQIVEFCCTNCQKAHFFLFNFCNHMIELP